MASGHMNRVKRPDTWLHRPMLRNVKKVLANPEPSTHGPKADIGSQRLGQLLVLFSLASRSQTGRLQALSQACSQGGICDGASL